MERFLALFDLHWGYERWGGHKIPLHDQRALHVALQFLKDFKPHTVILGGDILDCGCISHHNHGKPGATEGFRLLSDAKTLRHVLIEPIEALRPKRLIYIIGNHEDWLTDLVDQIPALEGIVDIRSVLQLGSQWKIIPVGHAYRLGKLVFVHGDQIKGGEHCAKWATQAFEANVRFGHHHTFQAYTKTSAIDLHGHTGIAVPCLCRKGPKYGGGSPNRWMQGFNWGYIHPSTGLFNDFVSIIVNGQSVIQGKLYQG